MNHQFFSCPCGEPEIAIEFVRPDGTQRRLAVNYGKAEALEAGKAYLVLLMEEECAIRGKTD